METIIFYLQEFWRECKYIEKKVIAPFNDNLGDFSSDEDSDDSDEE